MILKLNNKKITIKGMESVSKIPIEYQYELGTNYLTPILYIRCKDFYRVYRGTEVKVDLDKIPNMSKVDVKVDLVDNNNVVVKSYSTVFSLIKYYVLDTNTNVLDVYAENEKLKALVKKLSEQGEVI